jgi:molecular chaperone GrpE
MSKNNALGDESSPENVERQESEDTIRVEDRRHWQVEDDDEAESEASAPQTPSIIDEYRARAEDAEKKLLEYIEAFKRHKVEQDRVRERLSRDVDRRVEVKFGELIEPLLGIMDDLERSMDHISADPNAEPLLQGVRMTHGQFLATLEKFGVSKFSPDGETFDPNEAEALRVDPVQSDDQDNRVTETLKPGYRLGERVLRAAQVAVGRKTH